MPHIECFNLSRSQWEALIDEWVFSERNRAILKRRLLDGICIEPLAEEFDMSVRQINYILAREQKNLFSKIKIA